MPKFTAIVGQPPYRQGAHHFNQRLYSEALRRAEALADGHAIVNILKPENPKL